MGTCNTILSAGSAVYAALADDNAVTALVSRIYPIEGREGLLPAIVYRRSGLVSTPVVQGKPADRAIVQVECFAQTYAESVAIAEAVRNCIDGQSWRTDDLVVRSCRLVDASEYRSGDAMCQLLEFEIKI